MFATKVFLCAVGLIAGCACAQDDSISVIDGPALKNLVLGAGEDSSALVSELEKFKASGPTVLNTLVQLTEETKYDAANTLAYYALTRIDSLGPEEKGQVHYVDDGQLTMTAYVLRKYKSNHDFLRAFILRDKKATSTLHGAQAKLMAGMAETLDENITLKDLDTCKDALNACEDPVLKVYVCSLAKQAAIILASKALNDSDDALEKEAARRILEIPEGGRDEGVFVQIFPELSASVNKEETLVRLRHQLMAGSDRACRALSEILTEDKVQEEIANVLLKGAPTYIVRNLRDKE